MDKKTALKRFFRTLGFRKNTPYKDEYLTEENIKSLKYITFVSFSCELWMLIRYHVKYVLSGHITEIGIIFEDTFGFWTLLAVSALLFIYSDKFIKGRLRKLKRYSMLFTFLYFSLCVFFGMITTIRDIQNGRMMICYSIVDTALISNILKF